MAKQQLSIANFQGGISPDPKQGLEHSFAYGRGLDYRRKPSSLQVNPGTRKDTGSVVTDLILNGVLTKDGTMYFIGNTGKFYKRNTSGTWSVVGNVGGTATGGMIYREDVDEILIAKTTSVARYYPVSDSPTLTPDKYGPSIDISQTDSGGASTYDIPAAVSELTTDKLVISSASTSIGAFTLEPLYSIKFYITDKGAGDITVVLHDDANRELGTVTITNANLVNNTFNEFVFDPVVRLLVEPNARDYHFHVYSSDGSGTIQASGVTLGSTDFEIYANRLIATTNGFHPMIQYQHLTCIGNERYLSTQEPLFDDEDAQSVSAQKGAWKRHRLTFPPGYEVCGLAVWNEFLVVAAEKRVSGGSVQYSGGVLFFWNGVSGNYDFFVDVPEGAPYALHNHKNVLYFFSGGEWFAYAGGEPVKIMRMPNTDPEYTDTNQTIVVNPDMMSVRRGVLIAAFPTSTTDTDIEHGVYSFGSLDKNYPNTFNFDHVISTGTRLNASTLNLGMLKTFGDKTFLSWFDDSQSVGSKYGVDIIDNNSDPVVAGSYESLIYDFGAAWTDKMGLTLKVSFLPLPAGVTITPKYKLDRGSWVTGDAYTTVGGEKAILNFPADRRFRECQIGFDYAITGTASPEIINVALEYDDLREERRFV